MWSRCLNARDVGGFPTRYGVPTAAGRLFRTDTPELLDADGHAEFAAVDPGLILEPNLVDVYRNSLSRNAANISRIFQSVDVRAVAFDSANWSYQRDRKGRPQ